MGSGCGGGRQVTGFHRLIAPLLLPLIRSHTAVRILVFIEHGTRRMHLGGVTAHPAGEWTVQQARNLALTLGERFEDIRFLIRDRGSNFTTSFDAVFQAIGARILPTAVQAPRMNAICERLAAPCAASSWTAC
jgi:hypothetical protein